MEGPWGGVEKKESMESGGGGQVIILFAFYFYGGRVIIFKIFYLQLLHSKLLFTKIIKNWKWETFEYWSPCLKVARAFSLKVKVRCKGEANFCHINRARRHLDPDGASRNSAPWPFAPLCLIGARVHLQGERSRRKNPAILGFFSLSAKWNILCW